MKYTIKLTKKEKEQLYHCNYDITCIYCKHFKNILNVIIKTLKKEGKK